MESSKKTIEWVEVSVGPVIGTVSRTTARILIEFKEIDFQYQIQNQSNPRWLKTENENPSLNNPDQVKYVTCYLFEENSPNRQEKRLPLEINIPIVFAFENLKPGTRYFVQLGCLLPMGKSSFWTLGRKPSGTLHAAIVSCNEISIQEGKNQKKSDPTNDLWAFLGRSIEDYELDYIFHIGDQVYMDMEGDNKKKHIYDQCRKILKDNGPGEVSSKVYEEILEILRAQYRRTWTNPSIAYALANVPNLMICDDHEIRDDWGFRKEDFKSGTLDNFYGGLARQVYYEYQRQLRQDIPWNESQNNFQSLEYEYHDHVLNGVGVSFLEYRGCRSWFRESGLKETHIGEAQKDWIENLYKNGGKFDKSQIDSAIFISPLPLFLLTHFLSKLAYLKSDDIQEHWTYDSVPQLSELIDLLRAWKERSRGRELLIVGGDCHLGGWTDIFDQEDRERKILTQFITSAINNKPAHKIEKAIMDVLMKFGELNDSYIFRHANWRKENNYGIVKVKTVNKASTIETALVFYSETEQQMMITSFRS